MNQGILYELGQVLSGVEELGLFNSECTIQQRTNTVSPTGQPDLTDWVNRAGLVDIPGMFSIQRPAMPNTTATVRTPQQLDTLTLYHLLLDGYFPQILQQNQAVVNGTPYEIMAVESDSQFTQTRLAIRSYTL